MKTIQWILVLLFVFSICLLGCSQPEPAQTDSEDNPTSDTCPPPTESGSESQNVNVGRG